MAATSSQSIDPQLRQNIEDQLERLLSQLEDIEGLKEELSAEEYEKEKRARPHTLPSALLRRAQSCTARGCTSQDTKAQLSEFQESLKQMTAGNITLESEFDAARQAISAAISEAFRTPEVIRMFARKEPAQLRRRLTEIDRDVKLGKLDFAAVSSQAAEILIALKKLGEKIEPKEEAFLTQHMTASMADFEAIKDGGGTVGGTVAEAALKGVIK